MKRPPALADVTGRERGSGGSPARRGRSPFLLKKGGAISNRPFLHALSEFGGWKPPLQKGTVTISACFREGNRVVGWLNNADAAKQWHFQNGFVGHDL